MGGRYDATNVIDLDAWASYACGVTLLDYDHTRVLGNTLEEIAWEKGVIRNLLTPPQAIRLTEKEKQKVHIELYLYISSYCLLIYNLEILIGIISISSKL